MNKLSMTQKIAMSGLFIALVIIFTKVLSIQNLPVIPFVRISLGPGLIIFASLFFGPIYGGVIGLLSDLLGYFILDWSGYPPFWGITIMYTLMGIIPFFVMKITQYLSIPKKAPWLMSFIFSILIYAFVVIFLLCNDSVVIFNKTYSFDLWIKIIIIVLAAILFVVLFISIYFINKYFSKKNANMNNANIYSIMIMVTIIEIILPLFFGSLMKWYHFQVDFMAIFFSQAVAFFIDIPLTIFVIMLLNSVVNKIYHHKEIY